MRRAGVQNSLTNIFDSLSMNKERRKDMTKISVKSYLTKKVLEKQEKLRNDEN
jgi:hypothetical protein